MAIAGKVAITLSTENGGAWSADVTYDRLVAVKHNNNLYISRKTVTNVEPPNDEFWFLALEGFSGDDIEDIIDGTTQVGNAKTLDGHGAEYFVSVNGYKPNSYKGTTSEEIDQYLIDLHTNATNGSVYTRKLGFAVLHPIFGGGERIIIGERASATYGWQLAISYSNENAKKILFRQILGDETWSEWDSNVFSSDLANYLKKSGDKKIELSTTEADSRELIFKNLNRKVAQYLYASGAFAIYDETNGKVIMNSTADGTNTFNGTASGNLPLKGGTIDGNANAPLIIANANNDKSGIQFRGKSGSLGYLGLFDKDKPSFLSSDGQNKYNLLHTGNMADRVLPLTGGGEVSASGAFPIAIKRTNENGVSVKYSNANGALGAIGFDKNGNPIFIESDLSTIHNLLHTGNKPTGTYTGNGNATARTVNVGGVGNVIAIYYDGAGSVIVTPYGAFGKSATGANETIAFPKTEIAFINGILTIATEKVTVNENGRTFYYQVL